MLVFIGAKVSKPAISLPSANSRPLPVHIRAGSRTPLDLAQSRLDMLIRQSENASASTNTMNQVIKVNQSDAIQQDVINQHSLSLKIIELLKHFIPKDDVHELSSMLESINLENHSEELTVMKNLRDVVSKMKIS
jgi:hypothetical protein